MYNDTKYGGVCPFWHTPEAAWAERCIRHVSTARTTATCPCPPPAAGGQKEDDFLMEHNIPELVAQLTLEEKADTIQSHSRFAVQPRIMDIYMEEKAVDA